MPYFKSLAELRALSEEELIKQYDATATETVVGLDFLREELARRETAAATQSMVEMTRQMRHMTIIITVLTFVNAIAAIVAVACK